MSWKKGHRDFRHSGWRAKLRHEALGIAAVTTLFLSLKILPEASAGEYHVKEQRCSECHTAHFSQHGRPPAGAEAGGPFPNLLLFSSPTKLCLSCHDGSDVDAPDVLSPVITSYAPDQFPASGFFEYSGGTVSGLGHDLAVQPTEVPFSSMAPSVLNCTNCHDPHGSENYRNLRTRPGVGPGTALLLHDPALPTDDVFEQVHPNGTNPGEAYRMSNVGYRTGVSKWCAECHDRILPNQSGYLPAHFRAHPIDVNMEGGPEWHVDTRNWLDGTAAGFGAAIGDGIPGIPRVRFQNPTAMNFETSRTASLGNQVFCGTCHFAHGSPYTAGTTWPFRSRGETADAYAPCQQCHNE